MRVLLLQIEAWDEAIKSCNCVLRVQPNNVKALFRKAKASYIFLQYSNTFMMRN